MNLSIPPGHHLLRVVTMSPANFGDTGGTATVDRPVAVDVFDRLPYLPASSLKGVLAGLLGNVHHGDGTLQTRRTDLFGSPDEEAEDGRGRPGTLVLGDGELLCFPVPLRNGRVATVFAARTLYRLRHLGLLEADGLRRVRRDDAYQGDVAPDLLLHHARWSDFGMARGALPGAPEPVSGSSALVMAPDAAAALWQAAVEERTATALGEARRVRPGSLRTVEVIPPGTVFVSIVSNQSSRPAELGQPGPLQLGAWEATGCGFVEIDLWRPAPIGGADAPQEPPAAERPVLPEHEGMVRVYRAVRSIQERPEAGAVARSAILDLGPRLRIRGLPGTLAFCLARATGEDRPGGQSRERMAYAWLLRALLGLPEGAGADALRESTVAVITGASSPPPELEATRLWLRRFSETMLRREEERG